MAKLIIVSRDGSETTITGKEGWSVMENIRGAGFDELLALCGGSCSCATCHVHVDAEWLEALPPMGADEDDLLDTCDHRAANSRLSCQIEYGPQFDGLRVTIAQEDPV
ncbi:MAG: 2Fe-2S iron-sulfur cluster binding domain-containing protein [Alphaproteobacteria bacterium]|nr:2Fe-2S iron-sulfur cluster binding domain-containing protein [Alphaproteobacteria bacterium]MBV9371332.1 2Fe-2S iron-sulfur cluster binding domain-containing protein [Alphaproteobacteria bacterium]MBV9901796.1 2Fe-2S iron-sulfur cluster binding domain-containing protein [Alphaproteobacteria bacterium]